MSPGVAGNKELSQLTMQSVLSSPIRGLSHPMHGIKCHSEHLTCIRGSEHRSEHLVAILHGI